MIMEGENMDITCTIQVTHTATAFPEIIIQKDKMIVAHSKDNNRATYSLMATVEYSGNYTCKVETSWISKVSSIVVNITGRVSTYDGLKKRLCWKPGWPMRRIIYLSESKHSGEGWCSWGKLDAEPVSS